MVKCDLDLSDIRGKIKTTVVKYKLKKQSIDVLKNNITDVLKKIPEEIAITYPTAVVDEIYNVLQKLGIIDLSPEFFNVLNLTELLTGVQQGVVKVNPLETSTELILIKDEEQIKLRQNATSEFLYDAYGMVAEARLQALNITNLNLFDALFINRGSIKNLRIGTVRSNAELNDNIRAYQLLLLDNIVKYLKSVIDKSEDLSVSEEIKEALDNPILYDNKKNTGVLITLMPMIDEYLSPSVFKKDSLDKALEGLRFLYNDANNISNPDRELAKLKLDAYNSAVILKNFDSYLNIALPDIIDINDFGVKTGDDKYSISSKTSKLLTTWSSNDERNVEEEADFITKFAINTTPKYYWQGKSPIDGLFLTFADYQYLIGKIKSLSFDENIINIVFGKLDENGNIIDGSINSSFWNSLTENTKNIIKGKRLSTIINLIRQNPRKYIAPIFEILSNEYAYDIYRTSIFNKAVFSEDDLNKLYSFYKGVFSLLDNSLYTLSNPLEDVDYYSYITQVGDTITNVVPILYYRNNDGTIQCRTLISLNINNLRRMIEVSINTANSINTIKDFGQYMKELNIRDITPNSLTYTIPGTTLSATVYTSGNVIFQDNGLVVSKYKLYFDSAIIQLFLDLKLRLGMYQNPDLQNALRQTDNSYNEITRKLLTFASNIVLKQYIAYSKIKDLKDDDSKEKELKKIFGDNAPKYNRLLEIVESVSGYDVPTLRLIANAKATVAGIFTATQVKDGEGNALNLQTLSRLLGSHLSQFELQESQPWSATKDCLILNVPGLYEGICIAKEYYNDFEGSKSFVDMSVSEFAYSSFVLDYIGGLITREEGDNSLVGNGHVMFLPSVNSDKNTIDRIRVNLNKEVLDPTGVAKALNKFNHDDLKWLIAKLFGTIYTRMYETVQHDLNTIHDYIALTWSDFPILDYFTDFLDFNKWWYKKSLEFDKNIIGKSPADFIKNYVLQYNKFNRLHPLELIDLTHFIVKNLVINGTDGKFITIKKALAANLVLISQIARYNPSYLLAKHLPPEYIAKYPDAETFWNTKHREILKSLLKSKFLINTTGKALKELKYLKDKYPNWIDASGNVILAKIDGHNITSSKYLVALKIDEWLSDSNFIDKSQTIKLHPAIETWNYLDYLFTLEFMDCTVGSFINHPEKSKSKNVLVLEAGLYQAQNKRNVSFTAAMHEFLLNQLNGIPEEYNIAVIEDIKDELGTINGVLNDIKPFDGATFVHPAVVILENNSLAGAKAGITKKLFVHFKNERTGTGGIIKTCGFGITNDWIRNAPFLDRMMRKMSNHVWLNEDGTPATVNITKDYNKNNIILKNLYFKNGSRFFEIINIVSLGNNMYKRVLRELATDENGNPIKGSYLTNDYITEASVTINTNYALWNYLGGKNSMSVDGNTLKLSNSSVENMVTIMNKAAGEDENGNIITRNGATEIKTLDDLWQPLKRADIYYVPTAGAVKQGAANINSVDRYTDDIDYDILKIKMYQSGILLDKEHHADNAELSLMTLVISACASMGYTFEAAGRIYSALRKSTEISIKDHLDAVKKWVISKDSSSIQEVLYETIIRSLGTAKLTGTNFAYLIASDLIRLAREGKKIKFSEAALPLSDKTIYSKICSIVASYLTNSGIKLKIPGILSVLTPSYNIFQLYAGRKYESFTDPERELAELEKEVVPVFDILNSINNITDLELGRSYHITRLVPTAFDLFGDPDLNSIQPQTRVELIRTPVEYRLLKEDIKKGIVTYVSEAYIDDKGKPLGRDLAAYNVRFKTIDGKSFQLWDLDSAMALFLLNEGADRQTIANNLFPNQDIPLDKLEIHIRRMLLKDLLNLSKNAPDIMLQYNLLLSSLELDSYKSDSLETESWYDKYARWINIYLATGNGNKLHIPGFDGTVNADNFVIVEPLVRQYLLSTTRVRINNQLETVDKQSIVIQPYEIILPKVFATSFGLKEFDDLLSIKNNPDWFVELYVKNNQVKVNRNNYTLALKSSTGNHTYLLTKGLLNNITLDLHKVDDSNIGKVVVDNTICRVDNKGNVLYEITDDFELYIDGLGNEVIVTNNLDFYLNNESFESIELSPSLLDRPSIANNVLKNIHKSSNKVAKWFYRYITSYGNNIRTVYDLNVDYNTIPDKNSEEYKTSKIIRALKEKHTSFLKSLEVVAARIPSLSMQSFMPMMVVAFDNPDINTAYVSTAQILLQGSDF